ncbi:hypothetical protein WDU94_010034 [Cyamophila willieti]
MNERCTPIQSAECALVHLIPMLTNTKQPNRNVLERKLTVHGTKWSRKSFLSGSCTFTVLFFVCFTPDFLLANYPDERDKPKRCSHKNVVINYQGSICIPSAVEGEWLSENNCKTGLKDQCPEFNEAECMWFPYVPNDNSLNVTHLQLPCCRLKYYAAGDHAKKYTWMEVYYMNQYGTADRNTTVFDVVEIHRLIKKHEAFGENDQPDYPHNVLDPNGERGLKWVTLNDSKTVPLNGSKICPDNKDDEGVCSGKVLDFLKGNFKEGFDAGKTPPPSEKETKHNASISYEYTTGCTLALIDQLKTSVCKVTYLRRSAYSYSHTSGRQSSSYSQNLTAPYLEAQVYSDSKGDGLVRYAYLLYVDAGAF